MHSAPVETTVGITTYLTPFSGINGELRTNPEDFIVTELPLIPEPDEKGMYTIAWVKSTNWDTHLLVKKLGRRLQISSKRISFAGTKDKRAVTTQLMSFAHIPPEKLQELNIKDVTITPIHISKKPMDLGTLKGNHFEINIRNINPAITVEHIQKYTIYFTNNPGFPNYFGIQRFGGIRPITHLVGKHIIKGELEQAVMTYLAKDYSEESKETQELRQKLAQTYDFKEALNTFPHHLLFERAMLSVLQQDPTDFQGALLALPKNLLLMFINAYQSYLFNKIISMRLTKKLPIHKAIPGDLIISSQQTQIKNTYIATTPSNLDKVNRQINKNHAVISGILVGNSPIYAEGEMGEIEHTIIDQEKIDPRLFIIPEIPFLSSAGIRRGIHAPIKNLIVSLDSDANTSKTQVLHLSFDLQKGCYATSFLREWMKNTDVRTY